MIYHILDIIIAEVLMKNTKWISAIAFMLLCFAAVNPAVVTGQASNCGATTSPDHVLLSWTDNPATTQTISWRTSTEVGNGIVQYQQGKKFTTAAKECNATVSNFSTELGTEKLYEATLTGLKPNTTYTYRVGNGTNWSETHTFSTENPKTNKFKFIIFGDSQSGSSDPIYEPWKVTVHNAYNSNNDAKFMMNCGDFVEYGQRCDHWNAWFSAAAGVIDSIPEMPVQGNHETYTPKKAPGKPIYFKAQFPVPQNGPDSLRGQVYSFNYGNVHIAVLDSQQAEEKAESGGDILEAQKVWLDKDLSESKAVWKFVFFHKTPYDIKPARDNDEIKLAFCPIVEKYHVDVVFNAHDHGVARTYAIKDGQFFNKPSQGTIYYIVGRSGNKTYSDLQKKKWNTYFYDPQDQPNYLTVSVDGKKLNIKVFKQDNTLLDSFVIDKVKDVDSDTK